jgi:2'-5' RNA ligase
MRLFIAINLPEETRSAVEAIVAPVRPRLSEVRWVARERFHLTLKFLGECTADAAATVSAALTIVATATPSMWCTLSGAGVFPNFRGPRVVWVGVEQPLIANVAIAIERALSQLGLPAEARTFTPHLTVGRVDRELGMTALATLEAWSGQVGPVAQFQVRSLDLMQSELGAREPTYSLVTRAVLGGDRD